MTDPKDTAPAKWLGTRKRRTVAVIAGLALAVGVTAGAIAESRPGQHFKLMVAEGGMTMHMGDGGIHPAHFRGRHGFGSGGPNPFADMTDEEREKLIARGVAHAAIELDATDDQRDEMTALVTALAGKMQDVPEGFRDAGERMRVLLLADEIDAGALEAIRVERLAEVDRISREAMATLAEVAGLLTPEQRRTVAERMERMHAMRERRWRK